MSTGGLISKNRFNFETHYLNAETADVFFICGDKMKERIPAHKILLAASSNVFDKMFFGANRELNDVEIVDASCRGFREFLRYFYYDNLDLNLFIIVEVMYLAHKYMIECYFQECCTFLCKQKETDGLLSALAASIRFELPDMREKMEELIESNAHKVFYSEHFGAIDRDLLKHIIQITALRPDYMKCVFDGCIVWAISSCLRAGTDATVKKNLRDQLGDCFESIMFCSMSCNEIRFCIEKFGDMFTLQELQKLIVITSSKCPWNLRPICGRKIIHSICRSLPPIDELLTVVKGSCETVTFIAKIGVMLNAIAVNECISESSFFNASCLLQIYKSPSIESERILIHNEWFPFDNVFELRECILLEMSSVYCIEITFSNDVSYKKLEALQGISNVIDVLPGTETNFIVSLHLYV